MNKKIYFFFLISIVNIIFIYSLINLKFRDDIQSNFHIFTIKFEYFGMDAQKIEEIITIPLEKKLFELNSIKKIKSSCKYNQSITTLWFDKTIDTDNTYLSIRKITEDIQKNLPSDVQNPEIFFSNINDKPVITFSLTGEKDYIEKIVKQQFESIQGVSQVIVSGGRNNEVLISFSNDKMISSHINTNMISSTIKNINSPNLKIEQNINNFFNQFFFKNKLTSLKEIENSYIFQNEKKTPLSKIANIKITNKDIEEIVLLNSKNSIILNIKAISNSNLINISKQCSKLLSQEDIAKMNPLIIYDKGKIIKDELLAAIFILCIIIIFISIFILLFYQSLNFCFLIILEIITSLLWTLGTISILGIPITINSISGISISIGLIVDIPLIIFELFNHSNSKLNFMKKLKTLIPSILCSSITTTIVLIPLFYSKNIIPQIISIILPLFLMILYSTIISICIIPTFLIKNKINIFTESSLKNKIVSKSITFISNHQISPRKSLFFYILFFVFSISIFLSINKKLNFESDKNVIYSSIEFNSERQKEVIQKDISSFLYELEKMDGVKFVKTEISKGKAEISIYHNLKNEKNLIEAIYSEEDKIKNGKLFIQEETPSLKLIPIQIAITGNNSATSRNIIKDFAKVLSSSNPKNKIILNFKDDEKNFIYNPNNFFIINNQSTVQSITAHLRMNNYGAVIGKMILNNKETDIRLKSDMKNDLDSFNNIKINTENLFAPSNAFGQLNEQYMPTVIYRLNSRPCAYFTIYINSNKTTNELKKIYDLYYEQNYEEGYNIVLPSEIIENQKNYFTLFLLIIYCVLLIFIAIITENQNIKLSIKIIFSIFPTIFLPLFFRFIFNESLQTGDIIGITLLCGTIINNMIYISSSKEKRIISKIESKFESIIIQSITTSMSSLPILLFSKSNFTSSLSYFLLWGTISSVIVSFILFPSLLKSNPLPHRRS